MSLDVVSPNEYKTITDYDELVSTWCENFNNNTVMTRLLNTNSIGSGVISSGEGSVSGFRNTNIPNPEKLDPHNIILDDWAIYFSNKCSILYYNKYSIDLDPEGSSGVVDNGIRYLYLTDDNTHRIERSELQSMNGSVVYLLRYELLDNKIVSMTVLPDIAGTDPIIRTTLANQLIPVYDLTIDSVKGSTSLSHSSCKMLIEGGNIYKENDNPNRNLVEVPEANKSTIYYASPTDVFTYRDSESSTVIVDTNHYKVANDNLEEPYVLAKLPSGKFSIQQFSISPDGSLIGQYSSSAFNTMSEAVDSVTLESFNYINFRKNDIYAPVCRVVYQSGAVNSSDSSKFKVIPIYEEGKVSTGSTSGEIMQGQIDNLSTRILYLENRNNIVVTTKEGEMSVSNLRNNDMLMVIEGDC